MKWVRDGYLCLGPCPPSCPYSPPPPPPHICFVLFNGLNHDMNHDMSTTMKLRLSPGVVSVTGGSRPRECSVLENFAWLPALKTGQNHRSRTNSCITGNLPGCWLQKKCRNCRSRTNSCITGKLEIFLCNFGQIFHYFKQFRGIFKVGNSIFCSSLVMGGTPI